MRKSTLKKLFQETGDKLNRTLLENRQLRERLEELQGLQKADENKDAANISELQSEIESLKALIDSEKENHAKETEQIYADNEKLKTEINRLKGENFDLNRYSENLKAQLKNIDTASKSNSKDEGEILSENNFSEEIKPIPEPPKITLIQNAEEKDADAFEYASSAISEAVIKTAAVKYSLQNANDPYSGELITLLLGKNEIFKADVLQTVMSDLPLKEKQEQIDKALSETVEYFDSILGQISGERAGNAEHTDNNNADSNTDTLNNTDSDNNNNADTGSEIQN